jgi:signal transduction histidine kinase
MLSHRIELILQLSKSNKIIGYLCLGDRLTSVYTNRDIKELSNITDELVIAIENALAVQEIREFNIELRQKVDDATKELRNSNSTLRQLDKIKDEFIGMASHQLRTPLTSVKGYISMVLEGDAGKISSSQRQLLTEAFNSSERMVHLIGDFLNVSRLQAGKFLIDKRPVDLSKIVEQEVDSLQSYALARKMDLIYHIPKNFPIIDLDESKIRQVVMNFVDNALYYSKSYSPTNINLSVVDDNAVLIVKDFGIGVPQDEQAKLFTKFYRASNARKARPDGTGVGLYLAKKIIIAHGGKMIFQSTEGKGSTFGFSLPIKQG